MGIVRLRSLTPGPLSVDIHLLTLGCHQIGGGTMRAMRQNLAWAVGRVFEPIFGLALRALKIVALFMPGFSFLVVVNAFMLLATPVCPDHPPNL